MELHCFPIRRELCQHFLFVESSSLLRLFLSFFLSFFLTSQDVKDPVVDLVFTLNTFTNVRLRSQSCTSTGGTMGGSTLSVNPVISDLKMLANTSLFCFILDHLNV